MFLAWVAFLNSWLAAEGKNSCQTCKKLMFNGLGFLWDGGSPETLQPLCDFAGSADDDQPELADDDEAGPADDDRSRRYRF